MKYFSMFSGIGGFEFGIKRALHNKQLAEIKQNWERWHRNIDETKICLLPTKNTALCVGYSETNKYAIQIYKKHFGGVKNYGDATKIRTEEIPDFDLLVGGFPCQAFSIAGKRGGFEDTRGTLFFEIARIIKRKQPRMFVLENVKGLLNHSGGKTFAKILSTIDELGYDAEWQVLNSKHFGVPQNRERVFIIGHLRGTSRKQIFPLRQCSKGVNELNGEKTQTQISNTIDSRTGSYPKWGQYVMPVLTPDRLNKRQNGRRFKENGDPSFTLTGQDKHGIYDGYRIRRLTPTECERLQGFPDGWTAEGVEQAGHPIDISDSQRYKCLGNAVTVNVIEAIFRKIYI